MATANAIAGILTLADLILNGGKVTKVRLLADKMFTGTKVVTAMTVSYIDGELNGHKVAVTEFDGLTGTASMIRGELIEYGKRHGAYIKGSGALDNWDILH